MTEAEIAANKAEFLEIFENRVHREGTEKLLCYLEKSTFFNDPCSTKFHLNEAGGLCIHSLHVYHRLRKLVLNEKPPGTANLSDAEEETIAIVALLHDMCKIGCYQPTCKNQKTYDADIVAAAEKWQRKHDDIGDYVWQSVPGYNFEDAIPYGHGEKSVMMISAFVHLTREEAMAIRWHMGFSDNDFRAGGYNVGNAFALYPLAVLTHIADLEATYLEENENKK